MPIGGGASLGMATGAIRIDTSDLNRVRTTTLQVGQEAERNLARVGKGAQDAQRGFHGLTGAVRQWAGVMGVSLGAAGMFRLFQTSVTAASDLAESMSKTGVAFADSAAQILAWSETSATALGQSRQQALEAASSFGLLFSTMGLASAESADMSMALVQLATDMASINNISIEQALLALRSGLVGEVEPLRRVGVLLNAAAVEAKALEMGLATSTKAITEQDKVMARYQLVLEQTTLTQGDFARTSGELANQQRIAAAAAKDAQAAFGDVIQKDVIEATNAWTNALMGLTTWIRNARDAAGGASLGTALLEFGGWGVRQPGSSSRTGIGANLRQAPQAFVAGGGGVSGGGFSREVEAAQLDYWRAIQDIDRNAHTAIQQATEQYGQQRASTVADHEKSMARESEDFARQRARAVAAHERQIADIRQAAADREAQWSADLADRIAGLREDAARRNADADEDHNRRRAEQQATYDERITRLREDGLRSVAKIEADARRDSERAARRHRDTLLSAAANLDARAVAQEMRRWQTDQADRERTQNTAIVEARANLAERLEQERDNHEQRLAQDQEAFDRRRARENRDLQLRIDQEQAAHARRIADARAADEERLEDMQEAFDERIEQEDEERAIRLARQRQDHADQLAEMARAQALRIQQISEQQAEQRAKLNKEFEDQLADLGLFNTARIAEQKRFKDAATKLFNDMWGDWYTTMEGMHKAERALAEAMGPHPKPLDYPSLLDPTSLPGGYNPAASTGSSSRTITVAPGAITVYALPGQSEDYIAAEVLRLFEEAARD